MFQYASKHPGFSAIHSSRLLFSKMTTFQCTICQSAYDFGEMAHHVSFNNHRSVLDVDEPSDLL